MCSIEQLRVVVSVTHAIVGSKPVYCLSKLSHSPCHTPTDHHDHRPMTYYQCVSVYRSTYSRYCWFQASILYIQAYPLTLPQLTTTTPPDLTTPSPPSMWNYSLPVSASVYHTTSPRCCSFLPWTCLSGPRLSACDEKICHSHMPEKLMSIL